MDNPTPTRPEKKRPLLVRLDAAAQDMNAMLFILAIGLAVLVVTCFFALELRNALPAQVPPDATAASAAIPPAQAPSPPPGKDR